LQIFPCLLFLHRRLRLGVPRAASTTGTYVCSWSCCNYIQRYIFMLLLKLYNVSIYPAVYCTLLQFNLDYANGKVETSLLSNVDTTFVHDMRFSTCN
jgi:hypothetical protein